MRKTAGSRSLAALWLTFALLFPAWALAQGSGAAEPGVNLQTGDVLFIGLPGENSLNTEFRVNKRGIIWLPEVGSIEVGGLSFSAADDKIQSELKRFYRDIQGYELQLRERRMLINVLGQVNSPGEVDLPATAGVQEAITAAGGLKPGAQLDRLHVRRGAETLPFNFKKYLDSGDASVLPNLQTLDALFVPVSPLTGNVEMPFDATVLMAKGDSSNSKDAVNVFGQVRNPGRFGFEDGDNLIHYLMRAGGVNNYAEVTKIRVIGDQGPTLFNLTAFLDSGDATLLPQVQSGTTIFVPIARDDDNARNSTGVNVFGQVLAPGQYPFIDDSTLLDYLMQAGGVNNYAGVDKIRVISGGVPKLFNLTEFLDTGDVGLMPQLGAGATIFVPVQTESVQSANRVVYVMGEVFSPGAYEIQENSGFMDILANAGGPTRFAESRRISVLKKDGSVYSFDLSAYVEGAQDVSLPPISGGDAIFVPEKIDQEGGSWLKTPTSRAVTMVGAVQRPGRYEWSEEMSLIDLVGQAGGPTAKADVAKLRIIPGGAEAGQPPLTFDFEKFTAKGNEVLQPLIRGGYTVIMPELPDSPVDNKSLWVRQASESSIYVMGAVGTPGRYAFTEQLNFLDLLAAADGPAESADLRHIKIRDRRSSTYKEFDLTAYLSSSDESLLPVVHAEDVIFIPHQRSPSLPINVLGAVDAAGQYEFTEGMNLVQLLAIAGGPSEDADLAFIRVKPRSGPAVTINLVEWQKNDALGIADLPALHVGDTVMVPRQPDSPIDNKQRWLQLESQQTIYILGEVGLPGRYAFNDQMSFLDILAAANGPNADADLKNIQITYRNKGVPRTETFDLREYMDGGGSLTLPKVATTDLIFVPSIRESKNSVNVIGAVNAPGRHDYNNGMNLVDVLALAGGPDDEADLAHILVVPGGKAAGQGGVEFDLKLFEQNGEAALPPIGNGFTIIVQRQPQSPIDNKQRWLQLASDQTIYILGEVGLPGRYAFNKHMSFLDILAAANGPTPNADFENIQITYREGGQRRTETFNLSAYMQGDGSADLPKVSTTDLIFIPSEKDSLDAINVIGAVNQAGRHDFNIGMNLVDVLALAAGPTSEADVSHILIVPGGAAVGQPNVVFDLKNYERNGESVLPKVASGYTVIVPELPIDPVDNKARWLRLSADDAIYIIGEVGRPGRYAFNQNMGFLDILAAADGPTASADYENIQVTFRRPNRTWTETFNLSEFLVTGNEGLLPKVQTGDLILVPSEDDSSDTINVIGEANSPGRIDYSLGMNLVDVIALASGYTRVADVAHIKIVSAAGRQGFGCLLQGACTVFNLADYEAGGEAALPPVGPGDTIIIPQLPDNDNANDNKSVWIKQASEDSIYVMGAVGSPGRYAFNDKLHFLDILSAADGPSSDADLHNLRISHRNGPYALVSEVNLALYFETGDEHLLPTVRPEDVIYIPRRDRQWLDVSKETTIRVLGAVNAPGRYEFNSNMTILDLLAEAGGTSSSADVHEILIVNRSVSGNISRRFDLKKFAGHGDFGDLPTVRAGDTIYVPDQKDNAWSRFMETIRDIVSILSIVAIVVAL